LFLNSSVNEVNIYHLIAQTSMNHESTNLLDHETNSFNSLNLFGGILFTACLVLLSEPVGINSWTIWVRFPTWFMVFSDRFVIYLGTISGSGNFSESLPVTFWPELLQEIFLKFQMFPLNFKSVSFLQCRSHSISYQSTIAIAMELQSEDCFYGIFSGYFCQ